MADQDPLAALLARAADVVGEISVAQLLEQREHLTVVDVREAVETADGAIADALLIPRGQLEFALPSRVDDREADIVLVCASGRRSLLAGLSLHELGYRRVRSLTGGFEAWKQAGAPWVNQDVATGIDERRYQRHLVLPDIGHVGQERLAAARVAIVGAGGLGSAAAIYLAAAGVGRLVLIDDDVVSLSNLQRQVAHGTADLGLAKVDSAAATVAAINPDVAVEVHRERLHSHNVDRLLSGVDVVIDGSDNFDTTFALNDFAVVAGIPAVLAAVLRFDAQLTTVLPGGPCYRCLIPSGPADAPSCAEAGVMGAMVGIVGSWQALEAIKVITAAGETLSGRLLIVDGLTSTCREIRFDRDEVCPAGH
jgi:molybdopterin/thiamine biosynthesis adenylyltransferase/rhodanese-related sulfurtransferase